MPNLNMNEKKEWRRWKREDNATRGKMSPLVLLCATYEVPMLFILLWPMETMIEMKRPFTVGPFQRHQLPHTMERRRDSFL